MIDDYLRLQTILVSSSVITQTHEWLQEAGRQRHEAFVLWAGYSVDQHRFASVTAIRPDQTPIVDVSGIAVRVDGDDLHRVNRWLYDNSQVLIAQVHSHPGRAYHSRLDDALPIVTEAGQLSIVVPEFGKPMPYPESCAVYRLSSTGVWKHLTLVEVSQLFEVIDIGPGGLL